MDQLILLIGKEAVTLFAKWYIAQKAKGVDLDKLLSEAAENNKLTIDDLNV